MGYLSIKAFLLGLLLPMVILIVVGSIVLSHFDPPIVDNETGNFPSSIIAIPCLIISFIAWLIAYLTHIGNCPQCGSTGICLYTMDSSLTGKDYDYGAETRYGSIGTYEATFSDGSTASGNIEGTYTAATVSENRNYTYKYRCKCCGNALKKYKRLEGVNVFRKIKDAIQHHNETKD